MKKTLICASLMLFVLLSSFAKERTTTEIYNIAAQAIKQRSTKLKKAPRQEKLKVLHKTDVVSVMGYTDGGFAIVSNDDLMPEVLAIADSRFSGTENENLRWWLNAIEKIGQEVARTGQAPRKVKGPDPDLYPEYVEALVSAKWGQETPFNNLCPGTPGNRSLTGCVATALAQIFYTNNYPTTGIGERTIYYGSTEVYANFGENTYDYANMIDSYNDGYTEAEAAAVATLMLHCGVASNMNYSPEGSGTYSHEAAEGLIRFFGITTADFRERKDYNDDDWMDMIYEELAAGHAMYYSAVDPSPYSGGGHAFICDGYDSTGKVHINWGWNGDDNGFYNIDLLNPTYYSFTAYQDLIRGIYDPDAPGSSEVELVTLDIESKEAGNLLELIGQDKLNAAKGVNITGKIDNDDIALLKSLASAIELTEYGFEGYKSRLSSIDLTNAILENDELVENAFKDCKILRNIKLPRKLSRINAYAFSGCTRLSSITSYTYTVPKMGTRVFDNINSDNIKINVIAGSSDSYRRNTQWKTIINAQNVTEFGTCMKAKNAQREQGKPNPVLGYQLIGERVVGSPYLWTEATAESEPGTYPIFIEPGTIT